MKVKTLVYTLAFGAAVGLTHSACAQEEHHHKSLDATFAKKAAAGGLTEVQLGQLASQNGDSQDVKDFGSKMVTDHSKINDNLKAIATKDNLTIPDKPNEEQQALIDKLTKETGKAFDAAYIRAMVKAHVMDRDLFTEESSDAKNADLKQFASDSLSVIKDHLAMIEGIADSHGIATGHHGSKSMTSMALGGSSSSSATRPDQSAGDSGAGKSGVAPGSNGNPIPSSDAAGMNDTSSGAATAPSTGDSGAGKSGVAPGSNGNPAPPPQ